MYLLAFCVRQKREQWSWRAHQHRRRSLWASGMDTWSQLACTHVSVLEEELRSHACSLKAPTRDRAPESTETDSWLAQRERSLSC